MFSEDDVLKVLSSKDVTYGWDIVLVYHRDEINSIFEHQYIEKLRGGINFTVINTTRGKFLFENLVLGPPLISFENSTTEDSRATATIDFVSGSVIEFNDMGQVVKIERVEAGLGYFMILDIQLKSGNGTIGSLGEVLISFREASLRMLNIVHTPPLEVLEYFRNWLLTQDVTYQIGKLDLNEYNELNPTQFRIRTQAIPEDKVHTSDNNGGGAILLFIATNHNPNGGSLPAESYPWLIPDGYSHTFIVNKNLITSKYVKPTMDNLLDYGEWVLHENNNGIRYLKASNNAHINIGIITQTSNNTKVWSGKPSTQLNNYKYSDVHIPIANATLTPNMHNLKMDFGNSFSTPFVGKGPLNFAPLGMGFEVPFLSIGSGYYNFEKNLEKETMLINAGNINCSLTAKNVNVLYDSFITNNICPLMQYFLWSRLTSAQFPPIVLFPSNHIILPNGYITTINKIYMPSDLIGFGSISPKATALIIEPMKSTIAVNHKVQFYKNNTQNTTWSIYPSTVGSIDQTGLYTAPSSVAIGPQIIIVTAKNDLGQIASALVTLLPSSVALTPSFITINEGNTTSVQLFTRKYPDSTKIIWTIYSESEIYGSITDNGLYTPPLDRPFQMGYTFVVITATASDKGKDYMYICLVSKDTKAEFKIEPSYMLWSQPGESVTLRANSTLDFNPNIWNYFPANGVLGIPSGNNGGYSINFSPLKTTTTREMVFIRTMHDDKNHRSGYSVIEVVPK